MKPKPYLYPIYGLLIGVLIALAIVFHIDGANSNRNREIMLYCIRANVSTAIYNTTLPHKCLGMQP